MAKGEGLKGVALVVMHWVVLIFVDIDIYQSEIQVVHAVPTSPLRRWRPDDVWDHALEGAVLEAAARHGAGDGEERVQAGGTPPAGNVGGGSAGAYEENIREAKIVIDGAQAGERRARGLDPGACVAVLTMF